MGRRDSSSKPKSSKRKRDKISSKKKSRRKERKKRRISDSVTSSPVDDLLNSGHSPTLILKSDHRRRTSKKKKSHRDSSLSSYSDYESLSSDSDSDNAYKSRKARRSKVSSKDTKRRGRKRSTSPNGDAGRKRKRLDKDGIVKSKRKTSKKKLSKYSSSSESQSECQSGSSGLEKLRGRGLHKAKKMRKVRTPSSSCDRDIDPSISISNNDEELFPTNNSRRLRSVIVVINQSRDEVENRWEMDPHKEEIVNDSLNGAFSSRICAENVVVEDVPELGKSRIELADHQLEEAQTNDSRKQKETDAFVPEAALGGEILESILRQKALEKLRKFKQRLETGPRSTTVELNDESGVGTVDIDQNKLIDGRSNTQEISKKNGLSSKGEFSLTENEDKKLPDSGHFEKDPGMVKQSFAQPPKEVKTLVECPEEDKSVNAMEPSSSVGPISGEHNLEGGNEANFQKKTMSVMRGGEQVQVSYKVYIPKKAPALARRQLKR